MKFYQTSVWGFTHALRSLRNPNRSWDDSDTQYLSDGTMYIGPNDLKLIKNELMSEPYTSKFLQQIFVSVDIKASENWWNSFDQLSKNSVSIRCGESIPEQRTVSMTYLEIRILIRSSQISMSPEWNAEFTKWARSLPYSVPLIFDTSEVRKKGENN